MNETKKDTKEALKKDGLSPNKPSSKIKGLSIHLAICDIQLKQVKE